jgi:hypothetical protein
MNLGLASAVSVIGKLIGFILLIVAYLYIDKLEKTGCACSVHPYRESIHTYLIISLSYFFITVFFPPSVAVSILGPIGSLAYLVIEFVFTIVSLVFFILMMKYIKYLSVEKCKCSEGNTREILYIYSVVEVVLLTLFVVLPILVSVIKGAFALAVTTINDVQDKTKTVSEAVFNPLKSVKEIPRALRTDVREIMTLPKTAVKGVKKVLRR